MAVKGYYYLHTDGNLIFKPAAVLDGDPEYFNSDFVRRVWPVDAKNRLTAWRVIVEGLAMDADKARVMELAGKWKCDISDLADYMVREHAEGEITDERRKGLRRFLTMLGQDPDVVFDHIGATEAGEKPDMSAFV